MNELTQNLSTKPGLFDDRFWQKRRPFPEQHPPIPIPNDVSGFVRMVNDEEFRIITDPNHPRHTESLAESPNLFALPVGELSTIIPRQLVDGLQGKGLAAAHRIQYTRTVFIPADQFIRTSTYLRTVKDFFGDPGVVPHVVLVNIGTHEWKWSDIKVVDITELTQQKGQ